MKNYLPSKTFLKIVGGSIGILAVIFAVVYIFSGKTSFLSGSAGKTQNIEVGELTVADLIVLDTDTDGIADWEEALWGTDKNKKATFDDTPDSAYIAGKKKELNIEQAAISESEDLTETEKFARTFFSSYAALKSSTEADSEAINGFASSLGEEIVTAELSETYTEKDAKISDVDDKASRRNYYDSIKSIFDESKTEGIGTELALIGEGLAAGEGAVSPESFEELLIIGEAYKDFAKKMMGVAVPRSLINYHLRIANSADKTGAAVLNMQKIPEDPVKGLAGLSQHERYSAELAGIVAVLEQALSKEQ